MINRNIVALGFVSFFTDLASSMVTTVLPLFVVYILKEGIDKLGYITGIATFVSYIFRILFGYLSDKYQKTKIFLILGYSLSTFMKPLFSFCHSWKDVAILRSLERLGKAIRSAPKDTLISAYSQGQSGKSFGFHKMLDVAGEMVGSIIVFLILFHFGKSEDIFRKIFLFTLFPGIIALFILTFFVEDIKQKKEIKGKNFSLKEDLKLLPFLFLYFFAMFFMFKKSFFIVKAKDFLDLTYIPLLVILLYLIQTLTSYIFGIKIDKYGWHKIFLFSIIFGILSLLCLYFGRIIFAFIFLGLFLIASTNSIRVFISNYAKNKGTVFGLFYAGTAIFSSLGAIIIGILWGKFGFNFSIYFSLLGLSFLMLIDIIFFRFLSFSNIEC